MGAQLTVREGQRPCSSRMASSPTSSRLGATEQTDNVPILATLILEHSFGN